MCGSVYSSYELDRKAIVEHLHDQMKCDQENGRKRGDKI